MNETAAELKITENQHPVNINTLIIVLTKQTQHASESKTWHTLQQNQQEHTTGEIANQKSELV